MPTCARRRADAAPPLPRRLAFEELHGRRHHEAARAGQAPARRSGRAPSSTACIRRVAATSRSCCRTAPAWSATAPMPASGPTAARSSTHAELARRPRRRRRSIEAEHALQVLEPRLRAASAWSIEAVTGEPYADWIAREIVAAAGLGRPRRMRRCRRGTPFARGHSATAAARQPRGHPRRQPDPRARCRDRLRQHRRRPRALLRQLCARRAQRSVLVAGEPARDDAPAVARPPCQRRALVRPRHHERAARRLGLVRPFRRLPGLHHAHRAASRSRTSRSRC